MNSDQSVAARVAYLVHDVNDAAVLRRVELFQAEKCTVDLGGFRRTDRSGLTVVASDQAIETLDLGQTFDGRLALRMRSVFRHLASPGALKDFCAGAPVIVARNLEMLVLAARVRARGQRLVYECLDVHRLMLGTGWISRALRWLERKVLARTDLVIVSSPAFADNYFADRQGRRHGVVLVENKVPADRRMMVREMADSDENPGAVKPFVIGWFGMLRCRRTLRELASLAHVAAGRVEVVIAGRPSPAEFADFAQEVAGLPGLQYLGPYSQGDLPALYAKVDFVWAIDYFEEGLNSEWLLPNRLYEGLAFGAVPIALRQVETGRWLERRGLGVLVDDAVNELPAWLAGLSRCQLAEMRAATAALPEEAVHQTDGERRDIVAAITGPAYV